MNVGVTTTSKPWALQFFTIFKFVKAELNSKDIILQFLPKVTTFLPRQFWIQTRLINAQFVSKIAEAEMLLLSGEIAE